MYFISFLRFSNSAFSWNIFISKSSWLLLQIIERQRTPAEVSFRVICVLFLSMLCYKWDGQLINILNVPIFCNIEIDKKKLNANISSLAFCHWMWNPFHLTNHQALNQIQVHVNKPVDYKQNYGANFDLTVNKKTFV